LEVFRKAFQQDKTGLLKNRLSKADRELIFPPAATAEFKDVTRPAAVASPAKPLLSDSPPVPASPASPAAVAIPTVTEKEKTDAMGVRVSVGGLTRGDDKFLSAREIILLNQQVLKAQGFLNISDGGGHATSLWKKCKADGSLVFAIDTPGTTHDPCAPDKPSIFKNIQEHMGARRLLGDAEVLFIANVGGSGTLEGAPPTHYVAGKVKFSPDTSGGTEVTLSDSFSAGYLHTTGGAGSVDTKNFRDHYGVCDLTVVDKKDTFMQPDDFSCGLYAARNLLALAGETPSGSSPVAGLVSAGEDSKTYAAEARRSALEAVLKCQFRDSDLGYEVPSGFIAGLWDAEHKKLSADETARGVEAPSA
jgi:hypothetical protein